MRTTKNNQNIKAILKQIEDPYRQSLKTMPSEKIRSSLSSNIDFLKTIRLGETHTSTAKQQKFYSTSRFGQKFNQENRITFEKIRNFGKYLDLLAEKLKNAKVYLKKSQRGEIQQKEHITKVFTFPNEQIQAQNNFSFCQKQQNQKVRLYKNLNCLQFINFNKKYYLKNLNQNESNPNQKVRQHLKLSYEVFKDSHCINVPSVSEIKTKQKLSSIEIEKKKVLVLDLDETLIHCSESQNSSKDIEVAMSLKNSKENSHFISIRPYGITFLKRIAKIYQIIIFTASTKPYADKVLDEIDPNYEFIKHRLYRNSCIKIKDGVYAKDLRVLNINLNNVVLVDNSPISCIFQPQNAIPITSYYKGADSELLFLEKYLINLANFQNIRQVNRKMFQLQKYHEFNSIDDLIKTLYSLFNQENQY